MKPSFCWHSFTFALILVFVASFAHGQNLRWDLGSPGGAGVVTTSGSGLAQLVAVPGVQLNWCNHPANAIPCTNYANTYPSLTSTTPCPTNAQVVLQGSSTCQQFGDNFGNIGVYTLPNTVCSGFTCYDYTLTVNGISSGPYVWSPGGSSGGGGGGIPNPVVSPINTTSSFNSLPPAQPFVEFTPDPFGACPITGNAALDQLSDVNGFLEFNPNCPSGPNQFVLHGPPDTGTGNEDVPAQVSFTCVSHPGVYCLGPNSPGLSFDQQIAYAISNAQAAGIYQSIIIDATALTGAQQWNGQGFSAAIGTGWQPTLTGHVKVCNMTLQANVPVVQPGGWNFDPECGRQAGASTVGFAISYNGPPAYYAGLASNAASTGGSSSTYTFQVTGSGTSWVGNVVAGEIIAFCTATITGGKCGANTATNAAYGLISSVNSNTSLTVITNASISANSATSCGSSQACSYVIYPVADLMGDFSGTSAQNQNFDIRVHDVTIQCDGTLGCIPLANYNGSNMVSADHYFLHPSDNICLDIEGTGTQQSGPYDPGWCVGKNTAGQACLSTGNGVVVRSFTAVPQGLNGISVALNACSIPSGTPPSGFAFLIDAPVIFTDWHTLPPLDAVVAVLAGAGNTYSAGPTCPYICISQPFSTSNATIGRGDCAASVTHCVEWETNLNPVGYSVEGPERSGGTISDTFVDDNTGCTIAESTEAALKKYYVNSAGNVAFTTSGVASCQPPSISAGAAPGCIPGTAGALCLAEGTGFTNVSGAAGIYPDSTAHEFMGKTNGASPAGMMVRAQPGSIDKTGQTAAISAATLCAAAAGACNVAGEYHVHLDLWQSGSACSSVGSAAAGPELSWTDRNGTAHANVPIPLVTSASSTALSTSFTPVNSAITSWATGDFNVSTNGTVLNYQVTYTSCTTGTFTYNIDLAVTRLQ